MPKKDQNYTTLKEHLSDRLLSVSSERVTLVNNLIEDLSKGVSMDTTQRNALLIKSNEAVFNELTNIKKFFEALVDE